VNKFNTSMRPLELARCLGACAVALVLGLSGCAAIPPKVQSEYNSSVNFATYKTFAVLEPRASGSATDPGAALRMTQPAMQAVREAMAAKGLTEAPREKADCVVRVRGQSVSNIEVTQWGYTSYPYGVRRAGWGYSRGFSDVDVRQTTEHTLIVEIYDNASKNEAWVGWSKLSGNNPEDSQKLQDSIRNILASFRSGAATG
jgi:Domain of unknown function (DUF4136)